MKKIDLEDLAMITKEIFHAHFAGDMEPWFSYLSQDSVYLGTSEPMLFGEEAIRNHFKGLTGQTITIIQEEYIPLSYGDHAAQVCGQIIVESLEKSFRILDRFTISYCLIGENLKIVHQQNSYEYMSPNQNERLPLDLYSLHFVRNLLLEHPSNRRLQIRSGTQTMFIPLNAVLYIQSQGRKTEFVYLDRVITCNSSIGQIKTELPEIFYPIHRGYIVNTLFIVAIRRFEVELVTGVCLPIPSLSYQQVKQDLQTIIAGQS